MKTSELREYVDFVKPLLLGRYLSRPSLFSKGALSFRLGGEYPRLVFVMDNDEPRFYLSKRSDELKSLESTFLDVIKKRLYRAKVTDVSLIGDDRIVEFSLLASEEALFPKKRSLVFEMFPRHANLILLDEERKVLTAFKVSSLEDKRPLFKGLAYSLPPKNEYRAEESHLDVEGALSRYEELEKKMLLQRKKERFGELEKYLKGREKALKKKIDALGRDISKAEARVDGKEKGDLLFTYLGQVDPSKGKIVLDGVEIALDPRKSAALNAEGYYRQAKKAKESIRLASAHMKEANEELLDVESAVSQYEESDEEGLEQLSKELDIPAKGRPKAGWKGLSRSSLPFECFIGNTRLLFGKSSKENDCLTFLFARGRKLHWFHIQGDSGSHLVLKSENPSAEEIEIAAEIAVLLKGREDGDVIHALRGDVRKGSAPGQAVLKKFEVIRVNGISPAAKEALAGARKAERP